MPAFLKCCFGASHVNGLDLDSSEKPGASRTFIAKDSSYKSYAESELSQACASAYASLSTSSCEQWSRRIASALSSVESSLRGAARLLVVSAEGLPWVFGPNEGAPQHIDRVALTHLAEVLSQQAHGTSVVLRCCRDARRAQVLTWAPGQTVLLEGRDLLALPVHMPSLDGTSAALLLGWECGLDRRPASEPAHADRAAVTARELGELRRLAQFLGYGLLGDGQHARYVARVCRHLSLLPPAPNLHDLVMGLLEGVADLVLTKFALHVQLVLASVYSGANAAALFSLRGSGTGSMLRHTNSDANARMGSLLGTCTSLSGMGLGAGLPVSRPSATETGGGSITVTAGGGGGGAPSEASRVRAVRTSLAHTLLQQAVRTVQDGPASAAQGASQGAASQGAVGQLPSAKDVPLLPGSQSYSTCEGSRTGSGARVVGASGAFKLHTVIIPNANAHMLEDQQPCRDLLLCSKLTATKASSIVLITELPGAAAATDAASAAAAASDPALAPALDVRASVKTAAATSRLGSSEEDMSSGGGGASGGGGGCSNGHEMGRNAGRTLASAVGVAALQASASLPTSSGLPRGPVAPFHLALYMLSAEVLPAGLLRLVTEELQAMLPVFFNAYHTTLAASDPDTSCLAADWRRLQEQLLKQGAAGPSAADSSSYTAHIIPPAMPAAPLSSLPALPERLLRPGVVLESPVHSPVSPVNSQRSAMSSRLFKPNYANYNPPGMSTPPPPLPPPLGSQRSTPPPSSPRGGASSPTVAGGVQVGKGMLNGHAVSQGGGMVRKGVLALLAAREEAGGISQPHALSTPGSAAAACGYVSSPKGGKGQARQIDSPQIYSVSDVRPGLSAAADGKGSSGWRMQPLPQVTLERAAGPSALDTLVNSMRQGLAAVGTDDADEQASQAQDLAAVQLLEVLGRGGQGVVFRGTLHGLETAVKVLTDSSSSPGLEDEAAAAAAAAAPAAAAGAEQRQANDDGDAAAGGAGGAGAAGAQGGSDSWGADGKAGEARIRQAKRGAMEVAVIGTLSHPSIVQVYATFSGVVVVRCQYHDSPRTEMRLCFPDDEMLAGKDPGPLNQVICLEYCDGGTLMAAARSGAFRQPFAVSTNAPAFPALVPLYKSLLEVALALRYLHARKLVHCDLKAANVLLKSSTRDPRGWTCKLSDFGCARLLTEAGPDGSGPMGFRTAAPVGTLAHMAPECFIKNSLLTAAVDIYSFGVLMWELLMCRTPYAGMNPKEVPRQVIRHNLRPSFHPLAPSEYCALATRCWASKPERRPTAIDLVSLLEQLLQQAQAAATRETHVAAAAAATLATTLPRPDQPRLNGAAAAAALAATGAGAGANGVAGGEAAALRQQLRMAPSLNQRPLDSRAAAPGGRTPDNALAPLAAQIAAQRGGVPAASPPEGPPRGPSGGDGCVAPASEVPQGAQESGSVRRDQAEPASSVGAAAAARAICAGAVAGVAGTGAAGSAICLLPFTNPGIGAS